MTLRDLFDDYKNKFLTQSIPGSYKQPLSIKTCLFFLLLGIANLALGIIALLIFSNLMVITLPYEPGTEIQTFNINKHTKRPLYVYLQVEDFYQSHFFYAKSYSSKQLRGKATNKIGSCKPLKYTNEKIIYPCGLIANTFNQDAFSVVKNGVVIPISEENIAWSSSQNRIKNTKYSLDQISAPPDWVPYSSVPKLEGNERFANWMTPASFPDFRKLYGRIDEGLEAGQYQLITKGRFPYGRLSVVLAESSWIGVKNYTLSIVMIVIGAFLTLGSLVLCMKCNTFEA